MSRRHLINSSDVFVIKGFTVLWCLEYILFVRRIIWTLCWSTYMERYRCKDKMLLAKIRELLIPKFVLLLVTIFPSLISMLKNSQIVFVISVISIELQKVFWNGEQDFRDFLTNVNIIFIISIFDATIALYIVTS